jgi:hypothetical protein
VMLATFVRVSGRGVVETLVITSSDVRVAAAELRIIARRLSARGAPGADELQVSEPAAEIIVGEHGPGEES